MPKPQVPGGSDGKASAYSAGDPGLIPGQEDPLEKEMAAHSSTLVWKIPWTEEPGCWVFLCLFIFFKLLCLGCPFCTLKVCGSSLW